MGIFIVERLNRRPDRPDPVEDVLLLFTETSSHSCGQKRQITTKVEAVLGKASVVVIRTP